MAGLLDAFDDPQLRFGLGLLAAAGPRADGAGFGQRLMEGVGSVDAWKKQKALEKEQDMRQKMLDMQMQEAQQALDEKNWIRDNARKFWKPASTSTVQAPANLAGDRGPNLYSNNSSNMTAPMSVETPASFDTTGFFNAYASERDPLKAMAWMKEMSKPEYTKVGEGEVLLDPRTNKPVFSNPKSATPSELAKLTQEMMALPAGDPRRAMYAAAIQKSVSHAPAASAVVNMDKGMAAQIGPMMKDSKAAADGAVQTADAAARVIAAAQSGNVLLGPGADARLRLKQIASMVGAGGKNDAEVIASTRQAIRGLAEMTLQGRKQMTGQGAITDRESALAEKATSGDINDLTPQELVELARASARASRYVYDSHQRMIDAAMKDPEGAKLVPFYRTGNFPAFNFDFNSMTPSGGVDARSKADAILGVK